MSKQVDILAIDLAKSVFQLHGVAADGRVVVRRQVRRSKFVETVARLAPRVVMMEACGGAHHWARQFEGLGMEVKLLAAQYVKPYVRTNKNDRADAQGVYAAGTQPEMSTVAVKTLEQQDLQALHRVRDRCVKECTALGNEIRGLVAEYGEVMGQGHAALRRGVPELLEDAQNGLTMAIRELVAELYEMWMEARARVQRYERRVKKLAREREDCRRLLEVPGIGPVNATLLVAYAGAAQRFANGRAFSASLGLVARQHSSGGRSRLLGISKRGDKTVRRQLIHGARSALRAMKGKDDRLSRWACALEKRRGHNRAVVALANKLARIAWVMLARHETYRTMA